MLKRFLFETRIGDLLLYLVERTTGLAVVCSDSLAKTSSGTPIVVSTTDTA